MWCQLPIFGYDTLSKESYVSRVSICWLNTGIAFSLEVLAVCHAHSLESRGKLIHTDIKLSLACLLRWWACMCLPSVMLYHPTGLYIC